MTCQVQGLGAVTIMEYDVMCAEVAKGSTFMTFHPVPHHHLPPHHLFTEGHALKRLEFLGHMYLHRCPCPY